MKMRKGLIAGVLTGMIIFLFMPGTGAQTVVFDKEINWEWSTEGNNFGGYGFYWWHRQDGITIPEYGDMPTDDWTTPDNFLYGEFRMRFEVLEQPTDEPFKVQFGIWQDIQKGEDHPLTVCSREDMVKGTVFDGSIGSPSKWYNKESDDKVDFSRPEDFFRMGIVLWNPDPLCIPTGLDWNPDGCPEFQDRFFPMRARVTITAYPSGTLFPPSYSVDYENERTMEEISSSDQWSRDSVNWTTGNDETLSLTPGEDLYFRKTEDWTKIQTLDVKERPVTPDFTIDYINERTTETVGNSYWYSASSDMSQAFEGTGGQVALAPGTTIYFQTKWTNVSFSSEIQALPVPSRPDATAYTIDYVNERTNEAMPATHEYASTPGMNGAVQGTDTTVEITPGETLYFRKIATMESFASGIQILNPPLRPVISSDEGDTTELHPFMVSVIFFQPATNFTAGVMTIVNGSVAGIQLISALETSTLYQATVSPLTAGPVTMQVLPNAVTEGSFMSDVFNIHYRWGTGLEMDNSGEQLTLYPNPATGRIKVSSTLLAKAGTLLELFSLTGKLMISEKPDTRTGEMELKLGHLDCGVYILKLTSGQGTVTHRVILQGQ